MELSAPVGLVVHGQPVAMHNDGSFTNTGPRTATMTDIERLQQMIEEIRRIRNKCEPKNNQNTRYLRLSNAVSALLWVVDDLHHQGLKPAS
jgi:hypothetical protein